MTVKHFKKLPEHLQPRIISAVAFIHTASPDINKAVERINKLRKHLSQKELMYVMSLLVFDQLIDMVKDSAEFKNLMPTKRTIN
jgi:uncharacterized protein Yka (UPF0111/DUF47 family)